MAWKPWALFGLSLVCFAVVLKSQTVAVAFPLLAIALVAMVWGTLLLVQARIESGSQSGGAIIDPVEVARLRAEAEARRRAQETAAAQDSPSA
ncbi:MAG: hypothetical protein ACOVKS_11825 [Aquimonas sp.]|jgi:hypothetical protein